MENKQLEKCSVSGCMEVEDESMLAADVPFCTKHGEEFWKGYFEVLRLRSSASQCDCSNCKHGCKK